jgi:alkyl sulfatase BDS1-like metallo-beta-lactamase superfamily hydrolase
MRVRLDADKAKDATLMLGIKFSELDQGYGLEIRKGVCVFYDTLPGKTDATLSTTKEVFDNILLGETTVKDAIAKGDIKIEVSLEAVTDFSVTSIRRE